jgi:hypothetical protein
MIEPSTITPKERAVVLGLVQSLAVYCGGTPKLVINGLTNVLWNEAEGKILLKDAEIFEPLSNEIEDQLWRESKERVAKSLGCNVSDL